MIVCDVSEAVGRRLRQRRRLLQMTQAEVAEKIGTRPQQIQKYETGMNTISVTRFLQLASALSMAPGDLLDGLDL